jgi:hypothetical protein
MQASKWLQQQALLDSQEMEDLFRQMEEARIYLVGHVTELEEGVIPKKGFLGLYAEYILQLRNGLVPDSSRFRPYFSSILTLSEDHLFSIKVGENKQLIRVAKPVVQLQLHTLGYSAIERKFRPMIMGKDSIHWGLQFSYPQLYLDPATKNVEKVLGDNRFPNNQLFNAIKKWIREHTVPTPFLVDDQRINVPMRLGKDCFSWINKHPQLQPLGIQVVIPRKGESE